MCTIGSVLAAGYPCETSVVLGLSKQIAAELTSMGIAFSQVTSADKFLSCTGGCSGYLQKTALDNIVGMTNRAGKVMGLSSMWRSAAQ